VPADPKTGHLDHPVDGGVQGDGDDVAKHVVDQARMTKSECRIKSETGMTNGKTGGRPDFVIRISSFIRHSGFGIRHCPGTIG
jgi:hypothetical protein